MERFGLVAGDDHLDVRDAVRELPDRGAAVSALEVAAHARAQRLRLPDVQRIALLVAEDVDARLARKRRQRPFKVFTHSLASVSPCVKRSWWPSGPFLRLAAPGLAEAGPGVTVGAVEDDVRVSSAVEAETRMALFRAAGFRAVRVTSLWQPGQVRPTDAELRRPRERRGGRCTQRGAGLRHGHAPRIEDDAADRRGTRRVRRQRRRARARSARRSGIVIVGNEPNLNRFWLPQFAADGSSVSAAGYLQLLERTYDALKAVSPSVRVYGGALSPRGSDRPGGMRPTHSPTKFIQDLGVAYRASGRNRPVMDGLAIHPYGDNSSQPPSTGHPNSTTIGMGDYDKLVALLAQAFDGTAQPGSALPILYGEFGVESQIPDGKAASTPATSRR